MENFQSETSKLPFDDRKQAAVLGHLLTNPKFFEQARYRIEPKWFNDVRHGKIYALQLKFQSTYNRPPTIDEVRSAPDIMAEEPAEQNSLRGAIAQAASEITNYGLDAIRRELTEWLHARIYRESVDQSVKLYNQGEFTRCYQTVHEKIKLIETTRFDDENEISFDGPQHYLQHSEKSYQDGLTTGLRLFDEALAPTGAENVQGGLYRGDTTVFLAPSNVGKTTTLITVAAHNVKRGKSVLFMTHEGRPEDIREKILCCMLGVSKPDLFRLYKGADGLRKIELAISFIRRFFTYIPYNRAGMTVEDVIPIIRRRHEQRISESPKAQGYDLLVSDYPAKLGTVLARGGNLQRRHIDEIVYENYVQLALELGFHSLLAIQTNRTGSKVNRDDERLLTMEDVMESWGVMTGATNVISINRNAAAAVRHLVTYYIAKSRSSTTGRAIVCRSNYAASLSHSEEMGGISYMGTDSMSDKVEDLLRQYKGKQVDEHILRAIASE